MDQTAAQKSAMRRQIGNLRDALEGQVRERETAVCVEALLATSEYQNANNILVTMSFGSEIETQEIIKRAFADGKRIALPRVSKKSNDLLLFWIDTNMLLERSAWGIDEPALESPPAMLAEIDFVLVPGLAFDQVGNRLGYGRGYYDRLQKKLRPHALRVAMAFDCQCVDVVPTSTTDEKIDVIVTAAGITRFSRLK
ncbi:MAG: 5-formyltetrahydrofolate cyclo-ligase [Pseudomonadota bacterium]